MFYEARVLNNIDPQGLGRMFVSVPEIHGNPKRGTWADVCMPFRTFQLPAVGEYVWVTTRKQDTSDLIIMGYRPRRCVENYVGDIAERTGNAAVYKIEKDKSGNINVVEDTEAKSFNVPDRFTPVKTPGGIVFFANDDLNRQHLRDASLKDTLEKALEKIDASRDFHWGMEDPMGNRILVEQVDGKTYFILRTKGTDGKKAFEITHDTEDNELIIKNFTSKGKVIIDAGKDGEIRLGADENAEHQVLGDKLKAYLDNLFDVLNNWVPVPSDGGAALKALITSLLVPFHNLAKSEGQANYYLSKNNYVGYEGKD